MREHSTAHVACAFCGRSAEGFIGELNGDTAVYHAGICDRCAALISHFVSELGDPCAWRWFPVGTPGGAPKSEALAEAERIVSEAQRRRRGFGS